MLDESSKKKLRQLWYKRLGISFGLIVGVGFLSVIMLEKQQNIVPQIQEQEILIKTINQSKIDIEKLNQLAIHEEIIATQKGIKSTKPVYQATGKLLFKTTKNNIYQNMLLNSIPPIITCLSALIALIASGKSIRTNVYISFFLFKQITRFIPEEYIAELAALYHQLQSKNNPSWLINMIIFKTLLELIFALYIRIKIENRFLPSKNNKKNE